METILTGRDGVSSTYSLHSRAIHGRGWLHSQAHPLQSTIASTIVTEDPPNHSCCIAGSDVHCILLSATPFDRVSGLAYLQFVFKSGVGWGMYRALASREYHHIRKKWCYPYSCTRLFTTKNHTSSKSFQTRATIGVQG